MVTIFLFTVGVILAYLLGVAVGKARGKAPASSPAAPVLKCGCGHALSYHKSLTGPCHAQVTGPAPGYTYTGKDGTGVAKQCRCQCYDGPEPLPRSWIPPEMPA
jgi:hypothetical protein